MRSTPKIFYFETKIINKGPSLHQIIMSPIQMEYLGPENGNFTAIALNPYRFAFFKKYITSEKAT
jgi:hypothetical protein